MTLVEAGTQFDKIRRQRELINVPKAFFFRSQCRALHNAEVEGPIICAGWRQYVAGQPEILAAQSSFWERRAPRSMALTRAKTVGAIRWCRTYISYLIGLASTTYQSRALHLLSGPDRR